MILEGIWGAFGGSLVSMEGTKEDLGILDNPARSMLTFRGSWVSMRAFGVSWGALGGPG